LYSHAGTGSIGADGGVSANSHRRRDIAATGEETLRVRVTVGFDTLPEVRRGVLHACRSELGRKEGCP
jgi:hypothetical protein